MFTRLWFDRFLGGNNEKGEVNSGRPGEHIFDEPFMAGYIDDANAKRRQFQARETDINGDTACLFLRQSVTINAREGLDQARLTVVNMPGSAEYQIAGHG